MNQQHMCEQDGCISIETHGYVDPAGNVAYLCAQHAVEAGYCLYCQQQGGVEGYHADCWRKINNEEYPKGEQER